MEVDDGWNTLRRTLRRLLFVSAVKPNVNVDLFELTKHTELNLRD